MDGVLEAEIEESYLTHDTTPAWVSFWAGTFSGITGVVVGQPFDVVKTRLQALNYGGGIQCMMQTVKGEGFLALYKGLVPPMVGAACVNACLFFTYDFFCQEQVKRRVNSPGCTDFSMKPNNTEICIASFIAGFVQTFVITPFESVKVRLQTQRGRDSFKGPVDCVKKIYTANGMRGLFSGLGITMWRDVPSFALYFLVYDQLKDRVGVLTAGGLAGSFCWASIYPLDVLKSRIQTDGLTNKKYNGIIDCARKSYKESGPSVFFRGFPATIARGFVVNAGTFYGYEEFMNFYRWSLANR